MLNIFGIGVAEQRFILKQIKTELTWKVIAMASNDNPAQTGAGSNLGRS